MRIIFGTLISAPSVQRLILTFFLVFIASACSQEGINLPMEEWTLIETVQPPIYVRFLKQTDQDYYFESSAVPYEGWSTPSTTPERYAGGKGAVGDTITLGQRTVRYDFSPPLTETVAYLRFKVASYDEATNIMTIRLEVTPTPTQSIEGD